MNENYRGYVIQSGWQVPVRVFFNGQHIASFYSVEEAEDTIDEWLYAP